MAITGTGTQDDPYIVHSYEEIKAASDYSVDKYLKLANDIDCNDYGDDWEWETISTNGYITIDLNKHTIKNALIATDNYMFVGNGARKFTIKNGKILNIFCNMAAGMFYNVIFQNISASLSATNCKGNVISFAGSNNTIKNCAIYIKNVFLRSELIKTMEQASIINSDLWFDIENLNEFPITHGGNGSSAAICVTGCRIRGYAKGKPPANGDPRTIFHYSYAISSLIDFDIRNTSPNYFYNQIFDVNNFHDNANAVNKDKMYQGNGFYQGGKCDCTEEQLHDADFLNSIGFEVVKLEEV